MTVFLIAPAAIVMPLVMRFPTTTPLVMSFNMPPSLEPSGTMERKAAFVATANLLTFAFIALKAGLTLSTAAKIVSTDLLAIYFPNSLRFLFRVRIRLMPVVPVADFLIRHTGYADGIAEPLCNRPHADVYPLEAIIKT
jgi:hypothetical protein